MHHEPDFDPRYDEEYYEDKNRQRHNGLRGTANGIMLVIGLCAIAYVIYECLIHF